jgi:hypothetical protein
VRKLKASPVLEKTVKAAVRKRLKELGVYQFWPVPMGLGATTLDVLGCYRSHFFAVECKAPGMFITLAQKFTSDAMTKAGGVVLIIDSVDKAKAIQPEHLLGRPL